MEECRELVNLTTLGAALVGGLVSGLFGLIVARLYIKAEREKAIKEHLAPFALRKFEAQSETLDKLGDMVLELWDKAFDYLYERAEGAAKDLASEHSISQLALDLIKEGHRANATYDSIPFVSIWIFATTAQHASFLPDGNEAKDAAKEIISNLRDQKESYFKLAKEARSRVPRMESDEEPPSDQEARRPRFFPFLYSK